MPAQRAAVPLLRGAQQRPLRSLLRGTLTVLAATWLLHCARHAVALADGHDRWINVIGSAAALAVAALALLVSRKWPRSTESCGGAGSGADLPLAPLAHAIAFSGVLAPVLEDVTTLGEADSWALAGVSAAAVLAAHRGHAATVLPVFAMAYAAVRSVEDARDLGLYDAFSSMHSTGGFCGPARTVPCEGAAEEADAAIGWAINRLAAGCVVIVVARAARSAEQERRELQDFIDDVLKQDDDDQSIPARAGGCTYRDYMGDSVMNTSVVSALPDGVSNSAAPTPGQAAEQRGEERSESSAQLQTVFTGHSAAIYSCALSSMGNRLVSASRDRTLRIWDARNGQQLQKLVGHSTFVLSCDYSPNDSHVVSSSDDQTCKIWNAQTGKKLLTLKGHTDKVYCVRYSPTAQHVVSASCDRTCKVWNTETACRIQTLKGHTLATFSCCFSRDGRLIASASDDRTVKIWDWRGSQESIGTLSGHTGTVWSVSFSPDDKYLLSTSMDHTMKLWDQRMRMELRTMAGHLTPVHHAVFSRDGSRVVSCARDWLVKVWDVNSGECRETLAGHQNTVHHVTVSNDLIVSCSLDETLRSWTLPPP
eukprot:TRINITY_DN22_c0_g1_i3.p1 TRINITY_DN22_c0_g1~~TRINITY_DN22_c0_g1_i3.p1  ORF type:complete len:593 (+),score=132.99 TRINITY_DN22_c0_g1_i3:169-1947(+)